MPVNHYSHMGSLVGMQCHIACMHWHTGAFDLPTQYGNKCDRGLLQVYTLCSYMYFHCLRPREYMKLHSGYTVKIFGLFQPVKGCLSCAHVQRSNDNSIKYHISNK